MTEVDLSLIETKEFTNFIDGIQTDSILETGEYGLLLITNFMKEMFDFKIIDPKIENKVKSNNMSTKQFIKVSNKSNKTITFQHNENFDKKININQKTGFPEKATKLILINK